MLASKPAMNFVRKLPSDCKLLKFNRNGLPAFSFVVDLRFGFRVIALFGFFPRPLRPTLSYVFIFQLKSSRTAHRDWLFNPKWYLMVAELQTLVPLRSVVGVGT
jgi:hypothetical protein